MENTKPEEKVEIQHENLVLMTQVDAHIHERMKGQPKSIEEVEATVGKDFTAPQHVLVLPRAIKTYEKDFTFRWINKNKRAVDHALDVVGWVFVNPTLFPKLYKNFKHLFTANGSIERGDAILAFMSRKRAEELRALPASRSRERVESIPVQDLSRWKDRGEKYYKPSIKSAEDDSEASVGMVVQPDLESQE